MAFVFLSSKAFGEGVEYILNNGIVYEHFEGDNELSLFCLNEEPAAGKLVVPAMVEVGGKALPVTKIEFDSSDYLDKIESVVLPGTIKTIVAFPSAMLLKTINIPSSVEFVGPYAFEDCVNLPVEDGVRYADVCLVEVVDKSKTSYALKAATRFISADAFKGCVNITSLALPQVTTIWGGTFEGCSNLRSIEIPALVKEVYGRAFKDCVRLENVVLPQSVRFAGPDVFEGCSALADNGGNLLYAGTMLVGVADKTCSSYSVREGTTVIADYAFSDMNNVETVSLPSSLRSIGASSFRYTKISSISIPANVTTIRENAFALTKLASVVLPRDIETLGRDVFARCNELSEIECLSPAPVATFVSDNDLAERCKLTVPIGSAPLYSQTEGWNKFRNIVEKDGGVSIEKFCIEVSVSPNGTVELCDSLLEKNLLSRFYVEKGTTVELVVKPDKGYCLKSLVINSQDMTSLVTKNLLTLPVTDKALSVRISFEEQTYEREDLNEDGNIDAADVVHIYNVILGK
ncbi:MAG: leucine-rich repeat domain-containing protein [Bacteroidaceae bacterium]